MKATEKKENIEVFKKLIKYLEDNLNESYIFLCHMNALIPTEKEGGFNTRMIPQAVDYLKSQRPTRRMNRVIYNKPCYNSMLPEQNVWWFYGYSPTISINMEKIEFLKHLISKLKK